MMKPSVRSLALLGFLLLAGCAKRVQEPTPQDIPRLRRALEGDPEDARTLTHLGMAHFKAGNYLRAESLLGRALETGDAPGAAYLYLGLAGEELEKWSEARSAYASYLERGRSGPLQEEIEDRLTLIVRREMQARAREALARESEVAQQEPSPGTVAVFPFRLTTENEELEPLQVALADMMTTDLALSGGLTVLERTRIQTLLDEMALTEAGLTSPETGARAGRVLQAEHVVQGALTPLSGETLRFDTDVLSTTRRETAGEASAQDQLPRIFEMEKETVFRILDILGVDITPAEREAITENRSENLLAFLTYGRGLMAMDEGNFDQAARFFDESLRLDPGFGAAREGQTEARALREAETTSTGEVASRASPELSPPPPEPGSPFLLLERTMDEVVPNPSGLLVDLQTTISDAGTQAQVRDHVPEATNQDAVIGPGKATIKITVPRPGGGS
jgi:tetratricopeptide (TPR) repeat protein